MSDKENKKNEIKPKYRNYDIFIYVLVIIVAYFVGTAIFEHTFDVYGSDVYLFAVVGLIAGYLVTTIVYEIGKLIFGLIANFRLISLNILGFTFKKENGKIHFAFTKVRNYGGSTEMYPKDINKNIPYLYLLGGFIFTVLVDIGIIFLGRYLTELLDEGIYRYVGYLISAVSLIILILNIVPFYSGALLDGFVIRVIYNKDNRRAYLEYLSNLHQMTSSDGKLVVYKEDKKSDFFQAKTLLQDYYYYLLNNQLDEAKATLNMAIECVNLLEDDEIAIMYSNKIYFLLMENKNDEADELYSSLDSSYRRKIASGRYRFFKTSILLTATIELNYDNYEYLMDKFSHVKKDALPLLINLEDSLIDKSLDFVKNVQKEWFKQEESNQ